MNKMIKVIELFDIIAKGINIPTKVVYNHKTYKFNSEEMDYISPDDGTCLSLIVIGDDNFGESLNKEVEILEDEKETDIQKLELFEEEYIKAHDISMTETELDLIFKTNAIIKYLQKLDKKINKED